jgi:hypothetical protein
MREDLVDDDVPDVFLGFDFQLGSTHGSISFKRSRRFWKRSRQNTP